MTRVVSYKQRGNDRVRFGIVDDESVIDCTSSSLPGLIEAIRFDALANLRPRPGAARYAVADIILQPPISAPEKIICVGVNYSSRNEEYKDGTDAAAYPSLFVRFPGSFVGHLQPILRPKESKEFDYEGEIVLVIGRTGRHIARDLALDHVAGLTLANDGSLRDWLRHSKFNVTQGKNFDASGSIGPWIVPTSEIDLSRPLRLTTRVNGEVRQDDTTASMMFGFARLIEYISIFTTLKVGDLILTGTPTGAGARFDPPRWLKPGDIVEIEVPEIGVLSNIVADA
jgi:2-keto-4-pentenoate hydratase/2-oxohepta-3-ene-1,7-dioic acid hydratase in catechol pathway